MKCTNCGETKRIREHDKFCHRCGHNLKITESDISGRTNISISRVDSRSFLQIGDEQVEVADYSLKSSADGSTELSLVIKGRSSKFSSSFMLEDASPLQRKEDEI